MSIKLKQPEEVFVVLLDRDKPEGWLDMNGAKTLRWEDAMPFLTEDSAKEAIETHPGLNENPVIEKRYAWRGYMSCVFVPYCAIDHVSDAPKHLMDKNGVEYIRADIVPKDLAMQALVS